jgi:hypothetical protein
MHPKLLRHASGYAHGRLSAGFPRASRSPPIILYHLIINRNPSFYLPSFIIHHSSSNFPRALGAQSPPHQKAHPTTTTWTPLSVPTRPQLTFGPRASSKAAKEMRGYQMLSRVVKGRHGFVIESSLAKKTTNLPTS